MLSELGGHQLMVKLSVNEERLQKSTKLKGAPPMIEQQTFEQSGRPTILAAIGSFSVFDFLTELN